MLTDDVKCEIVVPRQAVVPHPSITAMPAALALFAIAISTGWGATALIPEGDSYARVSPGAGAWLLAFAFALAGADALARWNLGPLARVVVLLGVGLALWAALASTREAVGSGDCSRSSYSN